MASAFAKALPAATRTRALKYILGGTAGAVGLGTGATYAAYKYFVHFEETRREEAARGGAPAPKPLGLADGPSAWPIVAAASTCFSVGALGGLAISAGRSRDPKKGAVHAEGAILGAKAFVIATAIVGAVGVGIVYTIRLGLGVNSIREFGELVRGGPMVLDDSDGWDLVDSRHDYINGRLRLDSGLEIMYDLLHYSGSLGSEQPQQQEQEQPPAKALQGPQPVVLLHGLLGNRETMRGAIAPGLVEAGHAVLLADQRGATGGTTTTRAQRKVWWRWQPGTTGDAADREGVGIRVLADDTIKLLDKLHLHTPVHLVGCSIGGLIAEDLACRYPERVLSVTVTALDDDTQNAAGGAAATPTATAVAAQCEGIGDGFCPLDPKQAEHWAAVRAAAAAAYSPPQGARRPNCPVTLVMPPGSTPSTVLQRRYVTTSSRVCCFGLVMLVLHIPPARPPARPPAAVWYPQASYRVKHTACPLPSHLALLLLLRQLTHCSLTTAGTPRATSPPEWSAQLHRFIAAKTAKIMPWRGRRRPRPAAWAASSAACWPPHTVSIIRLEPASQTETWRLSFKLGQTRANRDQGVYLGLGFAAGGAAGKRAWLVGVASAGVQV
jgi:pimeloyl-ACP methyl ester carboxylesterase